MTRCDGTSLDILLVEDNPGDTRLIIELLGEKENRRIHVVSNGAEAIEFLKKRGEYSSSPRPDIIMLDLNLPLKSGFELLYELKSDESLKTVPVIIMTTSGSEKDVERAYRLHANCYITKPASVDELANIMSLLDRVRLCAVRLPSKEE